LNLMINQKSHVHWKSPREEMPDDEITVLLVLDDGEVWTGFRDGDDWRYLSADAIEGEVLWWADMPMTPMEQEASL
jgi:hypothetical protein